MAILAKAVIRRHKPKIIGITGSVGKTSAREAIYAVLKTKYRVRQPEKNFNNEIGLPLTILGWPHYGKNVFKWAGAGVATILNLLWPTRKNYPEILVLEYGVDRPGDMDYLLKIAKPKIAVITAVGDLPMHVEFFKDPEEVVNEKAKLLQVLPEDGWAILNHDDYAVYDLKNKTEAGVITFGFEEGAEVRAINYELKTILEEELGEVPDGTFFKIEQKKRLVPVRIHGVFGRPQVYAALAAAAAGSILDINLVRVSEALAFWTPSPGRLCLLNGIKNSFILDDTYNAGPDSMRAALDVLQILPGQRKIAVLGDMLELGKYTEQIHRAIGGEAAKFVDLLITVGARAAFMAEEARVLGLDSSQIFKFSDSESVGDFLDPLIKKGDLILVKGSQGARMEKVVEEIMDEPERASELLVRQEEHWKN